VEDFERDAPVTPWLKMIARRRSYDAIRAYGTGKELKPRSDSDKNPSKQRSPTVYLPDQDAVDNSADFLSSADRGPHALIETLDLLADLHPIRRRLLVADSLGETNAELAKKHDLPLGTVKSHIYYARIAAKAMLAEADTAT
jgi:DNA-directed RNA polymerase specialized sigma24 family protein